ncbi:MAG: hypothetical protein ABIR18_05425 [Chitinophagaceae bacterium]
MKFRDIILLVVCGLFFYSCKKPETGFLSDRLFYRNNPFSATLGRVTTSLPIEADGSTVPLNVKLLAVRDKNGAPATKLTTEYEIAIYKGEILATDTTLAQLSAKLGTAMYKPFNVNPIGGRLEVTPASVFADTGTYDFDIEVSNVKGRKQLNSIAKVRLTPALDSQIVRQFATTSVPGQEVTFVTQGAFVTTVQRIPGPNKIIIKFVDKNGAKFNPLAGEVVPRVSLPLVTGGLRYQFKQYDPYYPEVKTDTAFVYEYPAKTPTFPLYTLNNAYTVSYRIPNNFNDLNLNINPEFAVRLFPLNAPFVDGTWIITNKINFAVRL